MEKSLLDDGEELRDQDLVLKVNSKYAARLEVCKIQLQPPEWMLSLLLLYCMLRLQCAAAQQPA